MNINHEKLFANQLLLNPVENLPFLFHSRTLDDIEGLYITDKNRTEEEKKESKILFGGRQKYINEVLYTYDLWKKYLHADDVTLRPFSGLNAHMLLFLSLGNIGDTVLLLPEIAGGHYATSGILNRLGYRIEYLPVDIENRCLDTDKAIKMIRNNNYQFLFIDRSEGLNFEDFSEIATAFNGLKIIDASQYLCNILFEDFQSPFKWGFDIILSTLHKNFPGPQKALLCTNDKNNYYWKKIQSTMKECISNIHAHQILQSGLVLIDKRLPFYAHEMLANSLKLENALHELGVDIEPKKESLPPTHHIWIKCKDHEDAYNAYKNLEKNNILVNYRKLPYEIGYGLRLGTSAATLQGLTIQNCKVIASIIAKSINGVISTNYVKSIISNMYEESKYANNRF